MEAQDILQRFERDFHDVSLRRYTLRLGNAFYPHMKLVLQDFLLPDHFSFSVDSHDDHFDVGPECFDYEAWLKIKQQNAALKLAIEEAWVKKGIPTLADVVARLERETPPGAAAASDGGFLILIADDDQKYARAAHFVMIGEGYRTAIVDSAEAAMAFMKTTQPDLILSDWEMGAMTGLELARWTRARPGSTNLPFVLMSGGRARPESEPSVSEFLAKPYEKATLAALVRTLLAERTSPPELSPSEDNP
jgi:CheY-like chemotaxis protein